MFYIGNGLLSINWYNWSILVEDTCKICSYTPISLYISITNLKLISKSNLLQLVQVLLHCCSFSQSQITILWLNLLSSLLQKKKKKGASVAHRVQQDHINTFRKHLRQVDSNSIINIFDTSFYVLAHRKKCAWRPLCYCKQLQLEDLRCHQSNQIYGHEEKFWGSGLF